uniref:Uncharacterized protein n=1 Tax=Lepeophtheirus salmonis TaxID=72036 RepID=A0A0K2UKD3_LEPSM
MLRGGRKSRRRRCRRDRRGGGIVLLSRIFPLRGFSYVIHEVELSLRCFGHFPSRRKWSQILIIGGLPHVVTDWGLLLSNSQGLLKRGRRTVSAAVMNWECVGTLRHTRYVQAVLTTVVRTSMMHGLTEKTLWQFPHTQRDLQRQKRALGLQGHIEHVLQCGIRVCTNMNYRAWSPTLLVHRSSIRGRHLEHGEKNTVEGRF